MKTKILRFKKSVNLVNVSPSKSPCENNRKLDMQNQRKYCNYLIIEYFLLVLDKSTTSLLFVNWKTS